MAPLTLWPHLSPLAPLPLLQPSGLVPAWGLCPCYSLSLPGAPSLLLAPCSAISFLPGLFSCSCYSLPTWLYFLHFISILYHDSLYLASLFSVCLLHQNVRPRRVGVLFCLCMLWTECLCPHPTPAPRFICWSPNLTVMIFGDGTFVTGLHEVLGWESP